MLLADVKRLITLVDRFKETLKKSSLTFFRDENYKCDNLRFSHIKRFSQIKNGGTSFPLPHKFPTKTAQPYFAVKLKTGLQNRP